MRPAGKCWTNDCRTRTCLCRLGSATRRSFGHRRLRPARPPGPFLPRLRPRSWRPLFHADPTSLSASVGAGDRGSPNSKANDNARAKCGARECRQDQNHDRSPSLPGNNNGSNSRALPIDMRYQSDGSSLQSQIVASNTHACRSWQRASPATLPRRWP
jgi:hypothetical protein